MQSPTFGNNVLAAGKGLRDGPVSGGVARVAVVFVMIMVVNVGTYLEKGVILVGGLGSLLDGDQWVIRLQPMPCLPLPPTSRSCLSMTLDVPCWD